MDENSEISFRKALFRIPLKNHWSKLTATKRGSNEYVVLVFVIETLGNLYQKKSLSPSRLMRKFPVLVTESDGKSRGREFVRVVREAIMSSVS